MGVPGASFRIARRDETFTDNENQKYGYRPAEKLRIQKAKSLVRIKKRKRKGESGFDVISRGLIEGDRL